jgi:hypothetical protein
MRTLIHDGTIASGRSLLQWYSYQSSCYCDTDIADCLGYRRLVSMMRLVVGGGFDPGSDKERATGARVERVGKRWYQDDVEGRRVCVGESRYSSSVCMFVNSHNGFVVGKVCVSR